MNNLERAHQDMVAELAKSGEAILSEMTPLKAHVIHMCVGVCTEAGELLDAAKKFLCYGKDLDVNNIIEELGDIEFYMEGLRAKLHLSRDLILHGNTEKLRTRYPNNTFSNADAQARADKKGT